MTTFLERLMFRRARRIPAALCLLALAAQVMLPILHGTHDFAHPHAASVGTPELRATADHGSAERRHDAATCPQCRLVSQLKSLSPLATVATLPVLRTMWISRSDVEIAHAAAVRDSGAPRAPPVLA